MSSLEHLRKQAKLYLRWHRERYYPVAAQIRSVLPRFRDLSDREVLDAFKLSDAQEIIARKSGFESWPALLKGVKIKGVSSMKESSASTVGTSVILASEPQLFVSDIESALAFYVQKLGFRVVFSYGERPFTRRSLAMAAALTCERSLGPSSTAIFFPEKGVSFLRRLRSTTPSRSSSSFKRRGSPSTRH